MSSTQSQSDLIAKFAPLQSCVDVSFWSELTNRKLNEYKLAEDSVPITGWFGPSRYAQLPGQLSLDASSFSAAAVRPSSSSKQGVANTILTATSDQAHAAGAPAPTKQDQERPETGQADKESVLHHRAGEHLVPGTLTNFNTIEAFKAAPKQELLRQAAAAVWQDIVSGAAEQEPSRLSRFWLLTFADLKHFHFTYWFLVPALKPPTPFKLQAASTLQQAVHGEAPQKLASACDTWRQLPCTSPSKQAQHNSTGPHHCWLLASSSNEYHDVEALPISSWASAQAAGKTVMLAVADTSNLESHPGWFLRNVLLMAAVRWKVPSLQVLCVRDARGRTDPARSQLLHVSLPEVPSDWCNTGAPDAVGWEANAAGMLAPRQVDLSAQMSPQHLAEQAVDLNLHLMRWRAAPELDTARIAAMKCLLLGAGTLGCAVARTLQGWGVRHITFLDSSHVSFSNPVRQSLYEFNDCLDGGKVKAQAAADALRRIFPSVTSQGITMSIPMPGHPPATPAQETTMQEAAKQLDQLIQDHDAVFLLTDTRESRWLPTLLAAAHNRIAITAAVGFDSFLVMRHGAGPQTSSDKANQRLGCYFCNDVVAPVNSTQRRALDQQCTVARPACPMPIMAAGLAPIAGAVSVELLVALQQHPLGIHAPTANNQHSLAGGRAAAGTSLALEEPSVLGHVPHMVRGQLFGFQQTCLEGHAFPQCTACSAAVVEQYKQDGWQFLVQAIKEPGYLEDLTGLKALHQQTDELLLASDSDDEQPTEGRAPATADHNDERDNKIGDIDDWTSL